MLYKTWCQSGLYLFILLNLLMQQYLLMLPLKSWSQFGFVVIVIDKKCKDHSCSLLISWFTFQCLSSIQETTKSYGWNYRTSIFS